MALGMGLPGPAWSEPAGAGFGFLLSNDALAGGRDDRWRTGALQMSLALSGAALPAEGWELRLRAEALAPASLLAPDPADRPYAGVLSFGLHRHWAAADGRPPARIGVDLVAIGPQTGISDLHAALHRATDRQPFGPALAATQLGDRLVPTLSGELGRRFALAPWAELQPYVAARAGDETFVRAGVDLTLGRIASQGLRPRDEGTGFGYALRGGGGAGLRLVLGGDVAAVSDSLYLPAGGPARPLSTRVRLRAGLSAEAGGLSVDYGLAWLSREFAGQPEGQIVGTLQLRLAF